MPAKKYKIKVSENGPYQVSGGVPLCDADIKLNEKGESLHWEKGNDLQAKEACALCRCGRSSNKPFCDGTHITSGFNGTETASHEPVASQTAHIEGRALKLDDAEKLCAGARFCDRAGSIWNLVKQDDEEAVKTAMEEAANCPSGRLSLRNNNGEPLETELEPGISVVHDPKAGGMGPLWVKGGIPVEGADGQPYETRNRMTLCRCGKSKNKPFCDRSHLPPGIIG